MIATCPLGRVVAVSAGQPAPKANEFSHEGIPFIRAGSLENLLNGGTLAECEKVSESAARRNRLRLYPKDTVVFAKSGMSATLGRVYRLPRPAYVVSHLAALVPTGNYDPGYLTYWLRRNPPSHLIKDPAYPSIRTSDIEQVQVPNPPLSEQERIAAILDKADSIRRKRAKAVSISDDIVKSAFLNIFGSPARNPKNWPILNMEDLGDVQGGIQVSQKRDVYALRKPYLRVANVFRDELDLTEIKKIGLTQGEFDRVKLLEGDVLIVEGHGNPEEIGRAAVWDGSIEGCVHQNHLIRFRPNTDIVLSEYISRMLNSDSGRRQLISAGRTTSGLNTISTKKVKGVHVPVPPIELQHSFASISKQQKKLTHRMRENEREAVDLFGSIVQRAFRDEL